MNLSGSIEFCFHELTPESAVAEMPVHPGLLNPSGFVHAGAILWLAVHAATTLSAQGRGAGREAAAGIPVAVNLNANFTGNQKDGIIRAVSGYVRRGKRVSVVKTTVTGDQGRLLAEITTNHMTL